MTQILAVLLLCTSAGSCSSVKQDDSATTKRTDCTLPKQLLLRWGAWNDSLGVLKGYELDADMRLWKYTAYTNRNTYSRDSIGTVAKPSVCYFADTTRKAFLYVQTLFVKGPVSHFVEYNNPERDVALRAVWDARYQTFGSKEFRAIFDSLNTAYNVRTPVFTDTN